MPTLFGKDYTRAELLQNVGQISQVGGITPFSFTDGRERGTRGLLLENAAGLRLVIHPDRCLDIGAASYNGTPLAWTSATGFPGPGFYEPEGLGWLRSFGGGLVATCGLTNVGVPTDDQYGQTGQHGRIGNSPAYDVTSGGTWDGDDYTLTVTGAVREARVFAENLVLRRTLSVPLDRSVISITDAVTNEGHEPSPLMLLHHCNFGFPLVAAGTTLEGRFAAVTPRDAEAEQGKDGALLLDAPTPGYKEKVYWLDPEPSDGTRATVSLVNAGLGLRAALTFDKAQMPCLTEWKMMGQGTYTLGLEPGNVLPLGRKHYLDQGTLPMIAPGETRQFSFQMAFESVERSA